MNSYISARTCVDEEPQEKPSIVTQVFALRFQDGEIATARIEAPSPHQECPVAYSGALERLPIRDSTSNAVMLRVLFQSFAREMRAQSEEELIEN